MASTYLVCRHSTTQLLIPSADVLGVRELQVFAAPPTVPSWVEGVALTDGVAVVVASVSSSSTSAIETDPRRVVLLHTTQAGACLFGVIVDEVLELRAIEELGSSTEAMSSWWTPCLDGDGSVMVAPDRLRAALEQGAVA